MDAKERAVVDKIVYDIGCRRGIKSEWAQIDDDLQDEIKGIWGAFILEAIKQARNEALEEAAKVADELQEYVIRAINRGHIVGPCYISKSIRDLKEK
jgi:hypothetical protein